LEIVIDRSCVLPLAVTAANKVQPDKRLLQPCSLLESISMQYAQTGSALGKIGQSGIRAGWNRQRVHSLIATILAASLTQCLVVTTIGAIRVTYGSAGGLVIPWPVSPVAY